MGALGVISLSIVYDVLFRLLTSCARLRPGHLPCLSQGRMVCWFRFAPLIVESYSFVVSLTPIMSNSSVVIFLFSLNFLQFCDWFHIRWKRFWWVRSVGSNFGTLSPILASVSQLVPMSSTFIFVQFVFGGVCWFTQIAMKFGIVVTSPAI